MAESFKFEASSGQPNPHCVACEEMLADVLDETLDGADQAWFDLHVRGCAACSDMLSDAKRGAAWLDILKPTRPEPSAHLLQRILAQTNSDTGSQARPPHPVPGHPRDSLGLQPVLVTLPARAPAHHGFAQVLAFRPRLPQMPRSFFEPRLAMTAAMAFFSVALTLNLTGVKLDQVHASDLKPSNLTRTYFAASAHAVRYYESLRFVRVLESRVDDLRDVALDEQDGSQRRTRGLESPAQVHRQNGTQDRSKPGPAQAPQKNPATGKHEKEPSESGHGVSRSDLPLLPPKYLLAEDRLRRTRSEIRNWGIA